MFENITPTLLNAFLFCHNNAFFNIYNVKNPDNEDIYIGKEYDNSNSKMRISNFELDSVDHKNKFIIEVKKSKSNKEISKLQLIFYLYLTKHIFINYKGKLKYIENNEEEIIELTEDNEALLIKNLEELNIFMKEPKFIKHLQEFKKCEKCSFFELCNY